MRSVNIIAVILILSSFMTKAQTIQRSQYEIKTSYEFFRMNKMQRGEWDPGATKAKVLGSPYLKEEFVDGTVYTNSKTKFTGIPLRFNAFNDELEFKNQEGEIQAVANPEIIERVEFDGKEMIYIPYVKGERTENGYFFIVQEGQLALYQKPLVAFEYPKEQAPYQDSKPAQFDRKPDGFYLKFGDKPAQIVMSKKDLRNAFTEHKKQVETYIKKNKVKPNKPEKLAELVVYYNSL